MTELFQAAWQGWRSLANAGKLEAALLISLLFLWVYYKKINQRTFLIYITGVTASCVLPVTAAVLMLYQTRFYDYKWIWSIVPMTAAVGLASVLFLSEAVREAGQGGRRRQGMAAVFLLAGLLFCGGMGAPPQEPYVKYEERQQAQTVLEKVQERMQGREICLWAPARILGYARAYDAGIQLLYGRDMWDLSLSACSYDKYSTQLQELYRWMEAGEEERAPDIDYVETAISMGVNCILISVDKPEEAVRCLEEMLGIRAEVLDGYYLFLK